MRAAATSCNGAERRTRPSVEYMGSFQPREVFLFKGLGLQPGSRQRRIRGVRPAIDLPSCFRKHLARIGLAESVQTQPVGERPQHFPAGTGQTRPRRSGGKVLPVQLGIDEGAVGFQVGRNRQHDIGVAKQPGRGPGIERKNEFRPAQCVPGAGGAIHIRLHTEQDQSGSALAAHPGGISPRRSTAVRSVGKHADEMQSGSVATLRNMPERGPAGRLGGGLQKFRVRRMPQRKATQPQRTAATAERLGCIPGDGLGPFFRRLHDVLADRMQILSLNPVQIADPRARQGRLAYAVSQNGCFTTQIAAHQKQRIQ